MVGVSVVLISLRLPLVHFGVYYTGPEWGQRWWYHLECGGGSEADTAAFLLVWLPAISLSFWLVNASLDAEIVPVSVGTEFPGIRLVVFLQDGGRAGGGHNCKSPVWKCVAITVLSRCFEAATSRISSPTRFWFHLSLSPPL